MHARKFPLLLHLGGTTLLTLGLTCRYCTPCEYIIAHQHELEREIAIFRDLHPDVHVDDLFVVGTVGREMWKRSLGMNGALSLEELREHTSDIKDERMLNDPRRVWIRAEPKENDRYQESVPMAVEFQERYLDVLQNIEFAIVEVHRDHPELLDYDVDAALEALVSRYGAEARGRTPREHSLPGLRGEVYDAVLSVCEWRIGRAPLDGRPAVDEQRKTAEELAACLKRIRNSVQRWTRERGRQGYLTFVARYVM